MDWMTLLGFSIPIGALTAALCILQMRVNSLEKQVLSLATAGLHISTGLKIISETQNDILKIIKSSVERGQ